MYSRGSVIGEASLIDPEISPTPSAIFTGGQKSAKFGITLDITRIGHHSTLSYPRLKTQQGLSTLNLVSVSDCHMSSASLVKFSPHTPENRSE